MKYDFKETHILPTSTLHHDENVCKCEEYANCDKSLYEDGWVPEIIRSKYNNWKKKKTQGVSRGLTVLHLSRIGAECLVDNVCGNERPQGPANW